MQNIFVSQTSINDCGAACLAMILKLNDRVVSLKSIKDRLKIDREGVSAFDIINLSNKYGIKAEGYKMYDIDNFKSPFIAHMINEGDLQHFVVVLDVTKDSVLLADPASNIYTMPKDEFKIYYTGVAILFDNKEKFNLYTLIDKKLCVKLISYSILICIFGIFIPYFLSVIIKIIVEKENLKLTYLLLISYFFLNIVKEFTCLLKQKTSLKLHTMLDLKLTSIVMEKLINLPYEFYYHHGAGELVSKINDLSYVKEMIYMILEIIPVNLILVIGSLITLFFVQRKIFVLLFVLLFYIFLSYIFFLKKNFYETYIFQTKNENLNNDITDLVSKILTVKNLVKENYFVNKITNIYSKNLDLYKNITRKYQLKDFKHLIITLLVTVISMLLLVKEHAKIYEILFILSLEDIVISSAGQILKIFPLYANFKVAYIRLISVLDRKLLKYNNNSLDIKKIEFNKVNLKIDDKVILDDVTFTINKGDWVMVQGETGTGKSSLFKLLTKQIDGDKTGILINGVSILDIDDITIKNSITYVDQKAKLFSKTVEENIYFGKKEKNSVVSMILNLTNVNEKLKIDNTCSNISGGQMQSILIAQTLIKDSKVIIFDETTNALDKEKEYSILKMIKDNYKDKTIILITHRNTNVNLFNKVIKFDDKKVITIKEELCKN